ncbi:MAG: choice-of-anchor D domain-containing protein [Candidatus Binatus sp.]|uniref:choice-of-anchor D domain-containing protein n=1 Tax=Candidatus Binatus sp. TaxID=2811406 RepID=UPI003BAF4A01
MKIQFASLAKRFRHRALVFATVLVVVPTLWMSVSFSQDGVGAVKTPKHIASDATALARIMGDQRTSGGPIPPDAYQNAMKEWSAISIGSPVTSLGSTKAKTLASSVTGLVWKPIGPSGITAGTSVWNGRIDSIAISPTNPSVIYIGATDGGIWKTIDAGATWTPLTDHEPMLAIGEPGAIAIDPNNTDILYVGTSSFLKVTGAQGTQLNTTIGILKSTDGGASWIVLGSGTPAGNVGNANQFVGQSIFGIAVDPANSANLYLAASTGLYFSTDSGQNWTVGTGGSGFQADSLGFDASSPVGSRVLFAGVQGLGVVQSTNGGTSWTQSLNSTTPVVAAQLAAHSTLTSTAAIGKVAISLAPPTAIPNPAGVQVIYATIEGTGGNFPIPNDPYYNILGIFESADQGATWAFQGTGPNLAGGVCQCFYTNTIAVDPASPGDGINDIIYWGGTDTWISTNSGVAFSDITNGIHADSHSWAFVKGTPSVVYAGNDGGIWRSLDMGATWTGTGAGPATINAGGLQTGLLYHMDIKRDATASVTLGAFQDNGNNKWTGAPGWINHLGGDGLNTIFDLQNVATAYAIDNGGPNISTDSGSTWADITNNIPTDPHTNNQVQTFANAITVDPNNAGFLYFSGAANTTVPPPAPPTNIPGQLFQSKNFGTTWAQITNFTAFSNVGPSAVAPANSNNLAVIDGNSLYISVNALGVTPAFTLIPGTPALGITRLAFDPNDPTVLYFVTSGFSGFPGGHVFKVKFTVSSGAVVPGTVTDVSPPLDVPFDGLALDGGTTPTTIYAGSDLGVLRSVDGGVTWTTLDALHFPNAVVSDLQINPTAGVLRASTFGRGVFEFAAATGPVIAVNPQNNLEFGPTCAGSTVSLNLEVFNVGTTNLIINSVLRSAGSTDFTVAPNPTTPVTISPDAHVDFTIQFTPTIVGPQTATIAISSNDPGAPITTLTATGSEGSGTINVTGSGSFGTPSCSGTTPPQTLKIINVGTCNLNVSSAVISCADFTLVNPAEFPAAVSPDSALDVGVNFTPTSAGPKSCSLTITSDDPVNPVVVIPLTGNTALGSGSLTFPTGITFPPTVIQATGACSATLGVPIANAGTCPVQINSIGLTQSSVSPPGLDYSLTGLPTLPLSVPAGGQLGSGDLDLVFAPFAIAQFSTGTVDVTYVNDPITGATTTTHVPFCGEGVRRGLRVLVTEGGVPVTGTVKRIELQEAFGPEQQNGIFTIRTINNATLQTVTGTAPCPTFSYHGDFGDLGNPYQLKDGTYRIKVQLKIGGKLKSKVVRVNMDECTFTPAVVVAF